MVIIIIIPYHQSCVSIWVAKSRHAHACKACSQIATYWLHCRQQLTDQDSIERVHATGLAFGQGLRTLTDGLQHSLQVTTK